jgi:hypothetical protein
VVAQRLIVSVRAGLPLIGTGLFGLAAVVRNTI